MISLSLISIIVIFVVVEFINFQYEKYRFEHTPSSLNLLNPPQVWAHAGRHDQYLKNSPTAFEKAFETGAKGVEIDTHYDDGLSRFVLSHNFPYQKFEGKLKFLEPVFQNLGRKVHYWIDLKNLSMLNYQKVGKRLTKLVNKYNLQDRVFIESFRGKPLSLLSKTYPQTVYWVGFSGEIGSIDYLVSLHKMRALVRRSNFIAISMPYKTFLKVGGETFADFPLFIFTVNDKDLLDDITAHPGVKVVLSDNPNLYQ